MESIARQQLTAETLDRHVGQGEQLIEEDAVAAGQLFLVGRFELDLVRRQAGAERVVNQVEQPAAVGQTIAQAVQLAQAGDAGLENTITALRIDVFFKVAGQGGDDFNLLSRQEIRQRFVTRFAQDRQIAAIDDAQAKPTRSFH